MKKLLDILKARIYEISKDDDKRLRYQYRVTYFILAAVSAFMSVVNIFTGKYLLLAATLVFSILCIINLVISGRSAKMLKFTAMVFSAEFILLITFFIISGTPEGFSAIWAAMLPTCGLLLFKRKNGSALSGAMFLIIIFLFWTNAGRSLLQYDYTRSFMLRFPMLYAAFFAMAFFLESVRQATFDNYIYMYNHDPLTGALNRKGFLEHCIKLLKESAGQTVGFMIADLDKFKDVNDTFGHFTGDAVLIETVRRITDASGVEICRWGGEEFAAIFPGGISEETAEKIRLAFENRSILAGEREIAQTISVGAVNAEVTDKLTADILCLEADRCMYISKDLGRNKATVRTLEPVAGNTAGEVHNAAKT